VDHLLAKRNLDAVIEKKPNEEIGKQRHDVLTQALKENKDKSDRLLIEYRDGRPNTAYIGHVEKKEGKDVFVVDKLLSMYEDGIRKGQAKTRDPALGLSVTLNKEGGVDAADMKKLSYDQYPPT
jgi:hypothetical protein